MEIHIENRNLPATHFTLGEDKEKCQLSLRSTGETKLEPIDLSSITKMITTSTLRVAAS